MLNPFELLENRLSNIENMLLDIKHDQPNPPPKQNSDFLSEYVSKSEVRGKLASASTLWKYEKDGKLQSYGIGGKRFYKKSEVEAAFIKMNKKGGEE